MNKNELLSPEEFDKKIEKLEKTDPDFLVAISMMMEKISQIKIKMLGVENGVLKNKIKLFVFTSALVLIALFLKTMGNIDIKDEHFFLIYCCLFFFHVYAA